MSRASFSKRTTGWLIAGVILLLGSLVPVAYYWLKRSKKEYSPPPSNRTNVSEADGSRSLPRREVVASSYGQSRATGVLTLLREADRRFRPAFVAVAVITASYLFIAALSREAKLGHRTLAAFSLPVQALRGLGWLLDRAGIGIQSFPFLLLLTSVLIVTAGYLLIYLHRNRPRIRRRDVAIAVALALLAAVALFVLNGDLTLAALTGVLSGIVLLIPAGDAVREGKANRFLFLIPLGLGLVLRFYALAEIPNGYAEHAAVLHASLSIPLLEALSTSLQALRLQPFLGMAWGLLLHEHFGGIAVVAALGFKLFGISLVTTRLVSAALGTLTIYVAYRFGQTLGGNRLGLVFSFLLAVSPWHITISRYATAEHVLAPLQFLLSMLFLMRAVKGGRASDILLAAFFTWLCWFVYATNLVVPLIVLAFLLCRVIADPRLAASKWKQVLLGVEYFAILSYMPVSQLFPFGILEPNIVTGYVAPVPILSQWPDRVKMAGLEANQLFQKAEDPWFATSGPPLGTVQTVLLLPGILLAANALRHRRYRDIGLLLLIGLPLAAAPAVFAPDFSFRRLMLVTTLAALAAAFVLVRLLEMAEALAVSRRILVPTLCAVAVAASAAGSFMYFDRVALGEELGNAWIRDLGTAVVSRLGKEPMLVVVPAAYQIDDLNRYMKLMAYDTLTDAQKRGIPQESLYTVTSCEDTVDPDNLMAVEDPPRLLILSDFLPDLPEPCGPKYMADLVAQHPGSDIVFISPVTLPPDLVPAQR